MRFFYWCRGPPGAFSFSKMDANQQTTFSTLKAEYQPRLDRKR